MITSVQSVIMKVAATDDVVRNLMRLSIGAIERKALDSVHRALEQIAGELSALDRNQNGKN